MLSLEGAVTHGNNRPLHRLAGWIEPGLLPPAGILFVGGENGVRKSSLVANFARALLRAC